MAYANLPTTPSACMQLVLTNRCSPCTDVFASVSFNEWSHAGARTRLLPYARPACTAQYAFASDESTKQVRSAPT